MTPATSSPSPGTAVATSAGLGWRKARADVCHDPAELAEFTTAASPDLVLVLVTAGRYTIESRQDRRWARAEYVPGSVGMNAPGRRSVFRWRSAGQPGLESLHLRFPAAVVHQTLDDFGAAHDTVQRLDTLSLDDPYVSASLFTLRRALDAQAPALYADAVAEALLAHLVHTAAGSAPPARIPADPGALTRPDVARVVRHMRDRLGDDIGLDDLAALVNVSKFHFLRTFTGATGLTPHRYLTRMRLHHAADLLRNTGLSVQQIAVTCGYLSASHFAAAFRRQYGLSPARYRR